MYRASDGLVAVMYIHMPSRYATLGLIYMSMCLTSKEALQGSNYFLNSIDLGKIPDAVRTGLIRRLEQAAGEVRYKSVVLSSSNNLMAYAVLW